MKREALVLLAILLALVGVAAGCGEEQITIEKGKLISGIEADNPPWSFVEDQEYEGFSVDLCTQVAQRLGFLAEFVDIESSSERVPALNEERIDVYGGPYSINPERQEAVDFSDPYMSAYDFVVVAVEGSAIDEGEDLAGKKVGTKEGELNQAAAAQVEGASEVRVYPSHEAGLKALDKGEIEGYVGYEVATRYLATELEIDIDVVDAIGKAEDDLALAVKRGNSRLLDELNRALDQMNKDGTLVELAEKWLGEKQ